MSRLKSVIETLCYKKHTMVSIFHSGEHKLKYETEQNLEKLENEQKLRSSKVIALLIFP